VEFGTNSKKFILVIDTGSSDTWIPSDRCKSRACKIHKTYGSKDSSTLVTSQRTFDIRYGSGEIEGTVVTDTMKFAGFEMKHSFGVATTVSDDFIYFPIDGIMGLGFNNASQQRVPTIMDALVDKGFIEDKLFGIALARSTDEVNDGVINFGMIDSSLFEGEVKFSPSVSKDGLWEIEVDGVAIDGAPVGFGARTAVIDSGTSLILIPPQDAHKLHSKIPGAQTNGETFAVPCDTTSNIEFTFGGVTYKIPPKDYVGSPITSEGEICISTIIARVCCL
jgi:cathepsin D